MNAPPRIAIKLKLINGRRVGVGSAISNLVGSEGQCVVYLEVEGRGHPGPIPLTVEQLHQLLEIAQAL